MCEHIRATHLLIHDMHDVSGSCLVSRPPHLLCLLCCAPVLVLQGKRAALRSSTIMIRQPLQRLAGMQASDIDIYRRVTREKTQTMVRCRVNTHDGGCICM
jgi:hypothetical protein